jgi:hypothetical protein
MRPPSVARWLASPSCRAVHTGDGRASATWLCTACRQSHPACVAHLSAFQGSAELGCRGVLGKLDMEGEQVAEMDPVPELRKPARIHTGAPGYIQYNRRCWRQEAEQELTRACFLKTATPLLEPGNLVPSAVMGKQVRSWPCVRFLRGSKLRALAQRSPP